MSTADTAIIAAACVAIAWLYRGASLARSEVLAQLRDAEHDRTQAWRDLTTAHHEAATARLEHSQAEAERAKAARALDDRVAKLEDKIQGVLFRIGGGR